MKMRTGFSMGLVVGIFSVFGALAAAPVDDASSDAARDPVVLAVQKVLPAVVNISTERIVEREFNDPFEDLFRQFFSQPRRSQAQGIQSLGSGVIVDEDGWIITNWHVVQRATKINVILADGSHYDAQYVSGDDKNDLALLRIQPKKPLPAVEIAGESQTMLGETVVAIGDPFGFDHTVTKGVISAKDRSWPPENPQFEDVLQTDAAINPGNSGGPLINTRGQLVGINMAILSQAQGIGFAIPSRRVANLLEAWFTPEKRARLWLGVRFGRENGRIVVTDVQANSPAAQAGVQKKDKVVACDGQEVTDVLLLERRLIHKKAGDEVKFDVERGGIAKSLAVKLTALPVLSARDLMFKKFGVQVQPLTRDLAQKLGIPFTQGLLVAEVQPGSPGEIAQFQRGLVITQVAGEAVASMDRVAEQLEDVKTGDMVSMAIVVNERRGNVLLQQTANVSLQSR
jgi:S1-C subfamily serine protease